MDPKDVDAALVEKATRAAVENDPHLADIVVDGKVTVYTWETIPELGRSNYLVMMRAALAAVLPEIQGQAWDRGHTGAHLLLDETDNPHRAARLTATTGEPTDG